MAQHHRLSRSAFDRLRAEHTDLQPGCVVSVRYEGDDDVERYLVGSIEERRAGLDVVSPGSPLGSALIGSKIGDDVSYDSPQGKLTVHVVSIDV